jgi:hypothetical protein
MISFQGNIKDLADKMGEISTDLGNIIQPFNTENDALNDFNAANVDYQNNKYGIIENKTTIGDKTKNLFDSFYYVAITPEDGYKMNSKAYYFGIDDTVINPLNLQAKQRLSNRLTYNSCVNCFVLLNLYSNAFLINYLDDQQLIAITNDLEAKYRYLMDNNNFPRDIIVSLENFRAQARKYFDQLEVNISKVISVETKEMPLSVLLYQYYENFDNENEILSLNNVFDSTVIGGQIKILTSQL